MVHCQWEQCQGVWDRMCFAVCSDKRFPTDFTSGRSASRLKTYIWLSIFYLSLTHQREIKFCLLKGRAQCVVLVYFFLRLESQSRWLCRWEHQTEELGLQPSSAQEIDPGNTGNQQNSHLVLHSYVKGAENPFQQLNSKYGCHTVWCQSYREDHAVERCNSYKMSWV